MAKLLKSLELNGFKSFAQKTSIDLTHGITAIVGPNGSGKSNVIDGIRWLLGEREAKNLRGGKGEDLIFAGTPGRPRMSMAEASLHFENGGGFFPIDFPEITVTRRVNRDGSNQYFINRSEVRLKDIIDFFAQVRLGARGLVVVTQGNSGMFIDAQPLARREMIEEMLGLREYQLKKADAERRLKNTQINLDKVKALTEEILPHLRSLKRQTSRWEKRGQLAEELKILENSFFGGEWQSMADGFTSSEKNILDHQSKKSGLEKARMEAEEYLSRVEASQPAEREELNQIKIQTQGLLERRSILQKDLGRLEAQLELAIEPIKEMVPEMAVLVRIVKEVKEKLRLAIENPEESGRLIKESLRIIEESTTTPKAVKQELPPGLEQNLEVLKRDLTLLEEQISELKEKEKQLEKNQEQFYADFKGAVASLELAKDNLEVWESQNRELSFSKERLEIQKAEWERQVRQASRDPQEFLHLPKIEAIPAYEREAAERRIFRLRGDLASIGEIDEGLVKEAEETETRYDFLNREYADLDRAKEDLNKLINDLDEKLKSEFSEALQKINTEFDKFFSLMFGGGNAKLKLQEIKEKKVREGEQEEEKKEEDKEEKEAETTNQGIEVDVKLPRKRITSLNMLSGGERSLVGIAALFAMVSVSPPPFLVLDEVDAPLDERNARRFSEMLKEFSKQTQFILVTHNRATMEAADILYGVTMGEDGTSKVVSLKIEEGA